MLSPLPYLFRAALLTSKCVMVMARIRDCHLVNFFIFFFSSLIITTITFPLVKSLFFLIQLCCELVSTIVLSHSCDRTSSSSVYLSNIYNFIFIPFIFPPF